jgi:hypothetical protein
MSKLKLYRWIATGTIAAALSACGGGGDSAPAAAATAPAVDPAAVTSLSTALNSGLAALASYAGLQSSAFLDLFASSFLDAGYTKAQLQANLAQDATALTVSPDISSFPAISLSDATVSNCNVNNICTLTATLNNKDADTTSATFTTQVLYSNGKYLLLGDQKSS